MARSIIAELRTSPPTAAATGRGGPALAALALLGLTLTQTGCRNIKPTETAKWDRAPGLAARESGRDGALASSAGAGAAGNAGINDMANLAPISNQVEARVTPSNFSATVTPDQEYGVHLDLGRVYETQGNLEAALDEYARALEIVRNHKPARRGDFKFTPVHEAKARRRLAVVFDRLGMFPRAEAQYREAIKLVPDDHGLWNDLGYSYYLQARWSDSEEALKTAARLAPDDPRARINLGLTFAAAGRTREAYELLAQVAGPAVAHANIGYILASTGRRDEARRHYAAALELEPNYAPFQRALARLDAPAPNDGDARNLAMEEPPAPTGAGRQPKPDPRDFWEDPRVSQAAAVTGIPLPHTLENQPKRPIRPIFDQP